MWLGERFSKNLERVRSLIASDSSESGDQLRAAVVLLHATLEDLLRTVASIRLPHGPAEFLGRIPFPRPESRDLQRKTTFTFEELSEYRGRTVDDVIFAAVDAYLDRSNYNNVAEIVSLLATCGLTPEAVKPHASDLSAMIARRHAIVHRADLDARDSRKAGEPTPISASTVEVWVGAVEEFGKSVVSEMETSIEPVAGGKSDA